MSINEAYVNDRGEDRNVHFAKHDNGNELVGPHHFEMQHNTLDKMQKTKEEDELLKEESRNFIAVGLQRFWTEWDCFVVNHRSFIKGFSLLIVIVAIILYIAAVIYQFLKQDEAIEWCQGYGLAFIVLFIFVYGFSYYLVIQPYILPSFSGVFHSKPVVVTWRKIRPVLAVVLIAVFGAFLIWDTSGERRRLVSIAGLIMFILLGFIFSKHPTRVKWRTVFMGILIQFLVGLFAIRWSVGRQIFRCIGIQTEHFLEYAYVGASFVYGDLLVKKEAVFAFEALSAIFFVSMIVQVLFYLGWMQVICLKLGWFMQFMLGTTVMESVNAVSSVFLGMTEAPLLYKPYIKDLTRSEMHAVMAGGFSTIAGTVFAAFTSFGVEPSNIITASIMTAPAALCYAKLVYPESVKSKTDSKTVRIYESEDKSVMDAVIQGAFVGIGMVQGIIATIIACVSFVACFNDFLAWLGLLAGVPDFTLETIFSYLLYPVVWMMGVEPSQCLTVSRLIGIKITVNEFVAYVKLGEIKKTGAISPRTEAIATFALCSFANPGSLGILISTLTTLCPSQRFNILAVAIRAFISAIVISFLTACIAGALMPENGFSA
ncbi:sodium/nucleoside cotransporter 2-like [Macrosteles quadrilineatus]|uniref:sodium/nucleoside cotransporter 2-like n=1 Tax=Macrosteles quadrilineatus TaxID=74068 RepID=UPI0023E29BC9|nr:sodium/nucleoside cotransporter 2-like [Macrosteles quadrilineatus]XP_054266812.1 sodium/nucleoside cotransporter 2-like [Macrosteles quadrilineatus]